MKYSFGSSTIESVYLLFTKLCNLDLIHTLLVVSAIRERNTSKYLKHFFCISTVHFGGKGSNMTESMKSKEQYVDDRTNNDIVKDQPKFEAVPHA